MNSASLPPCESERLKALRSYGLLATRPEQDFDDLTRLASRQRGSPIAFVLIGVRLVARPVVLRAVAASLLLCSSGLAQEFPDLGFTTRVSAALVSRYTQQFGPPAPDRLAQWSGVARTQKAPPFFRRLETAGGRDAELIQIVNEGINRQVKWVDDKTHWGADDYWATPAESIGSAGGDCEDFAIAKYYLLKELGVPLQRLRITYVRALMQNGQAHMVLAYYARPEAEPLILDNLDPQVRPASQRTDLEPVYSFNDDEVQLVQGAIRGKPAQIRAWGALQQRLTAESRT